jgi:RNA polymerase sigma factor (sigma-70 family)
MMSAEDPGSVTHWIDGLKAGQPDAADALWQRYYQRVITVARQRLGRLPQQAVEDAEDAALSAIHGLFTGAAQGRFERLNDRVDLWQLLVAITVKKALSQRQRHDRLKRGGNHVIRGQTAVENVDDDDEDQDDALALALSREPDPESAAMIQDQFQNLLDSLSDPTLRQIALWRMDGLSNAEIARKMGCVVRTVERKIERIRLIWEEIGDETPN